MTPVISVTELKKVYRRGWNRSRFEALRGISLEVAEGEAFGFIGPNGAGKSTTIKILTGVMRATSGDARMFGVHVGDSLARKGLGYVPENPYLFDYLTPAEILTMGRQLHSLPKNAKRVAYWLDKFGLADVAGKPIRSFSKGMTQRTALAHAMAVEPRLLILDEPLSGLDPIGRRDVIENLIEYKKSGGTLFFTSHVLYDVERLADRFGLIHKGTLRAVRSPAELVGGDDKVVIRSLGDTPLPNQQAEFAGRWWMEVPRTELWTTLECLRQSGHTLVEVKPTLSLESAFMKVVSAEQD